MNIREQLIKAQAALIDELFAQIEDYENELQMTRYERDVAQRQLEMAERHIINTDTDSDWR